uniref:GPI transamidase component PIG-U n=1 Tax=Panagrellus redivivus TaxID=6233 RepID=A0A7E4UMD6_PANRE
MEVRKRRPSTKKTLSTGEEPSEAEAASVPLNGGCGDVKTYLLAFGLRIIAAVFLQGYLSRSNEFTTPWNSFRRVKEAVHVQHEYGVSPYEGDFFHLMPIFLTILAPFAYVPAAFITLTIIADVTAAYILQKAAITYLSKLVEKKQITVEQAENAVYLVLLIYLFNPMAIGSAAIGSISVLVNLVVVISILAHLKGHIYLATILTISATVTYSYYIVLLAPIFVSAENKRLKVFSVIFATLGSYFALNCLVEHASRYFGDTFYLFWNVPDLTPNVGVWWYFFVFAFDQYRSFFLWVFQLAAVLPVVPLSWTLRADPTILTYVCLGHVAVLSSYPSYAEAVVLLAMYPMFAQTVKYSRYTVIGFGTVAATFVLAPIMFRMWMITGSGNANFYFAVVIVYVLALSFLVVDIMYGFVRHEFGQTAKEAGVSEADQISADYPIKGIIPFRSGAFNKLF